MKLLQLKEARYAVTTKNAREAFDIYEQFFNEYEDPESPIEISDNIIVVERDYSETIGANYASIYLWIYGVGDDKDKMRYIVKEFIERVGLPYTNIDIDDRVGGRYHATVYYKEDID